MTIYWNSKFSDWSFLLISFKMSYSLAKNKEGSALLISLIVLVLLSLASTVFVEKVWNFSKASTGIKDSNRAYYFSL
jgi:hypothetical protein